MALSDTTNEHNSFRDQHPQPPGTYRNGFAALRTVMMALEDKVAAGIWRRVQGFALQQVRHAGLTQQQQRTVEHWLKGGLASAMTTLPLPSAQAILHYIRVALCEYLGPAEGDRLLARAVSEANSRLDALSRQKEDAVRASDLL